jgi:hypothetical protein
LEAGQSGQAGWSGWAPYGIVHDGKQAENTGLATLTGDECLSTNLDVEGKESSNMCGAGAECVNLHVGSHSCECKSGFVDWPNTCVFTRHDGFHGMTAAEIECVRNGGHLASIHNDAQNEAIKALGSGSHMWIGFHDMHTEAGCADQGNNVHESAAGFIWTDGSSTGYTNWNYGEPNDWGGGDNGEGGNCARSADYYGEDCVEMMANGR